MFSKEFELAMSKVAFCIKRIKWLMDHNEVGPSLIREKSNKEEEHMHGWVEWGTCAHLFL